VTHGRADKMLHSLLHRYLWQSLPRRFRRWMMASVTAALAPRLDTGAPGGPPYIVAGALRSPTGLGESARLCHDALKAAGLPVYGIDLTGALFQQIDQTAFSFMDGRHLTGPGTLIIHVNAPLMPMALMRLGKAVVSHRRVIGYWAWELEKAPPDWRSGVAAVHEVWAPSNFTARAIAPLIAPKTCRVVPHPVALRLPPDPVPNGDTQRPFTVLTMLDATSSIARKNPLAAIEAFRSAFGDDTGVRLFLKISGLGLAGESGRKLRQQATGLAHVVLIEDTLGPDAVAELFAESDVLLSLHRSEGFGLTLAEAMLHQLPVVATCWSGEADFLSESTAVLIGHHLIPARDPQGTYDHPEQHWAEADVVQAAAALRRLRSETAFRIALGRAGRARAVALWSGERYLQAAFQSSADASTSGEA
jgi:glycosyltransferase involved in cell wall biosynthesis